LHIHVTDYAKFIFDFFVAKKVEIVLRLQAALVIAQIDGEI